MKPLRLLAVAALTGALVSTASGGSKALASAAAGCSVSWAKAEDGDWSDPDKWDTGVVPQDGSDVCILQDGSYTVALTGLPPVFIHSLQLGSGSGDQTLVLSGNPFSNGSVIVEDKAEIGSTGRLTLTTSSPDHSSAFWAKGGTTNLGTIVTAGGGDGFRDLRGDLINNGLVDVEVDTSYGSGGSDTLTNHGVVEVAAPLEVRLSAFVNGVGGTIEGLGTHMLTVRSGTFTQGDGDVSPVVIALEGSNLNVTGTGAATFVWHGVANFSGGLRSADQTLLVEGTCNGTAGVNSAATYVNRGTIQLFSADCAAAARLDLVNDTHMTNRGSIEVFTAAGGSRGIFGALQNYGVLKLGEGVTLDNFAFVQESSGKLETEMADGPLRLGRITSNLVQLDGTIAVEALPGYTPVLGDAFDVVSGGQVFESFRRVKGAVLGGSTYFRPTYTPNAAQLVVTAASAAISPRKGHAGTAVSVTGAGFPASSSVAFSFTDSNGTQTSLGNVTTDAAGSFATTVGIPLDADPGLGKVTVRSAVTGVRVSRRFTVT